MSPTSFPMDSVPLIACTRCAILKARCDRKVPCSQCVARNYVCQPRFSSRRPRAPRKPSARTQAASTALANAANPEINQHATGQEISYTSHNRKAQNNGPFDFTDGTLSQEQLDLTGYEDFMRFTYPMSTGGKAIDGSTSNHLFNSFPSFDVQVNDPPFSPHVPVSGGLCDNPQEFQHGPNYPLPPSFTSPQVMPSTSAMLEMDSSTSLSTKMAQDISISNSNATDDVLGQLIDLLARPDVWSELNGHQSNTIVAMSQDARDRIVATVQLLLQRALEASCSTASSSQGLFGRIVSLPPSHVLTHFINTYASRIDSMQPYLGLPGSPTANIQDILQIDTVDIGMLLIVLLIAHGAILTDHHESQIFAHGLIEVCRVALNHVLERRCISQPMVGGIALQLLTLCARSGKDIFVLYAMLKRDQYLRTLRSSGTLQPKQTHDPFLEGRYQWEKWEEVETQNRHAYAWVYVDLEVSLLHDVLPILSINDLQAPLPHSNNLWHAKSYKEWIEQHNAGGMQVGHTMPSLSDLFRSFLLGRLTGDDNVPLHHLRLLLHPLQAMVLEQQQLLRSFNIDEPSDRYRVLSKTRVLSRMQEMQDLVQSLSVLLNRHTQAAMDHETKGSTNSMDWTSIIMLHLVSLNVCIAIPDIEKCGKEEPPISAISCEEMWHRLRYPEGENHVLFHAGQVFRIIDSLPMDSRPMWWPVAIYRASLACWSLRTVERLAPRSPLREIEIDTLLPSDKECFLKTSTITPVVTISDNRRLPILEGGNSLLYCISKLEDHPIHLVSNVLEKARYYLGRWH